MGTIQNGHADNSLALIRAQKTYQSAIEALPPLAREVLAADAALREATRRYEDAQIVALRARTRVLETASPDYDLDTITNILNFTPQSLQKSNPYFIRGEEEPADIVNTDDDSYGGVPALTMEQVIEAEAD